MTERNSLVQEVGTALRDHGITAAITALIGGTIALLAAVSRRAFTNDAMLSRLDRELLTERDRVDRKRSEDRKSDADRLERIETDIRAMRDLMFEAFQRGRSDGPTTTSTNLPSTRPEGGFRISGDRYANHELCSFPRRA